MINQALDTIAAIATPNGHGALGIIRLSGSASFSIFSSVTVDKERFFNASARTIHRYTIHNSIEKCTIESLTAAKFCAPKSFSGEDCVELFCHGGPIVMQQVLALLIKNGARLAEPGEFTRRAYLQGKIELLQAEAIHELIMAKSVAESRAAMSAYSGLQHPMFDHWRTKLTEALALLEAAIEFSETDDLCGSNHKNQSVVLISQIAGQVEQALLNKVALNQRQADAIVVIAGPPNAGKSSIFNALLQADRSIVHNSEGTTRDAVSERFFLDNGECLLIDTAGIRSSDNEIESLGIVKTKEWIKQATMVLWVTAADKEFTAEELECLGSLPDKYHLVVINKTDTCPQVVKTIYCNSNKLEAIAISLVDDRGGASRTIVGKIEEHLAAIKQQNEPINSFICGARQELLCKKLHAVLSETSVLCGEEILAESVRQALAILSEITVQTTDEDVLTVIFSKFCIGK